MRMKNMSVLVVTVLVWSTQALAETIELSCSTWLDRDAVTTYEAQYDPAENSFVFNGRKSDSFTILEGGKTVAFTFSNDTGDEYSSFSALVWSKVSGRISHTFFSGLNGNFISSIGFCTQPVLH